MEQKTAIGLNRDVIKYLAMLTMFLNHFANVFLPAGSLLTETLLDVGYFTAPVMCYFLVEGYQYTRSKRKYGQRLFVFALLSEIPFVWATGYYMLNMIFTLFLCFVLLCVQEKETNRAKRTGFTAAIFVMSLFSDWALFAPLFTLLFWKNRDDRSGIARTFAAGGVLFAMMNLPMHLEIYPLPEALLHSAFSAVGIAAAAVVILCFYNGKRAVRGQVFSKWFFYLFYPLHLLLLCVIRALIEI